MTVFEKLKQALQAAEAEQELPDFLAGQIRHILDHPERFRGREGEIAELAEKVMLYDTYGQTGYLGMGVSNLILEKALQRLLAKKEIT